MIDFVIENIAKLVSGLTISFDLSLAAAYLSAKLLRPNPFEYSFCPLLI